jgi:hypothetical protein
MAETTPWVALTRAMGRLLTGFNRDTISHAGDRDGNVVPDSGRSSGRWGQQLSESFSSSIKSLLGLDDSRNNSRNNSISTAGTTQLISGRSGLEDVAPAMTQTASAASLQPTDEPAQESPRADADVPATPIKRDDSPMPTSRNAEATTLPTLPVSSSGGNLIALSSQQGEDESTKGSRGGRGAVTAGLPPLAMVRTGSSKDLGPPSARRLMLSARAPDDPPSERSNVAQATDGSAEQPAVAVPAKPRQLPSIPIVRVESQSQVPSLAVVSPQLPTPSDMASPRSALKLERLNELVTTKGRRGTAVKSEPQGAGGYEDEDGGQAKARTGMPTTLT